MDVRVQDFLDDKFQSATDLGSLDSLLENVKHQQNLLKRQLADAKRLHTETTNAAHQHRDTIRRKGEAFQRKQADIDKRLLIVTQSETSDDAVRTFQTSMDRLRKLDAAEGYVKILNQVKDLEQESKQCLANSGQQALEPYFRLRKLMLTMRPLHEAAEGAAPHLMNFVQKSVDSQRNFIYSSFAEDLEKTLKKMQWPQATETVPLALEKEWASTVGRLLNLQRPELEAWEESDKISAARSGEPPVLLALEVIVRPLEQRFTYHFSGNKPTNRLDKPEYFLTHVSELLTTYAEFMENAVQPELLRAYRGFGQTATPAFVDATAAFITAVLPMLRTKLKTFATQVETHPQLLSHLMHEVMAFDTSLRESYSYTPLRPTLPWRGLSDYLLETCNMFPKWLTVERDFALERYQEIIDSPEAGELDFDSVAAGSTKPTKAAIRVNDLLETVTDHYRSLMSFSQKLRFLIDIQIAIFDLFHQRLHASLEAYLSMTSTIARTVHGMSKDDQAELQGVKGLDRLCRVFGSAEYLERAMRDWSDDIVFLELWDELQQRASNREQVSSKFGGLSEIQQKTSATVGIETPSSDGEGQGALFDETTTAYRRLRMRSENIMVETLTYNIREALRPYGRINTWASVSSSSAGSAVSAELEPTLRLLDEYLNFLHRAVGRGPLHRIVRQVGAAVQAFIWDNVLSRNSFSTAGAAQLIGDVGAIGSSLGRFIGEAKARMSMRKLVDGVTLLALPVKAETGRPLLSRGEDDEDDSAWDDGEAAGKTTNNEEGSEMTGMGLFEAERLIFQDNESARRALDTLGLDELSEGDARIVLRKRVELGS